VSSPLIPRLTDWHGAAQLHPCFVCDVFSSQLLLVNQLGVVVDGRPFTPEQMQSLAREMSFAEKVGTHPSRACVPSTSRVPMAMQHTDRYVYYEP
jgi:hypothetical protein